MFVEKEIGRCFCAEDCIKDYFHPTIEQMQEDLRKLRSEEDLSEVEAEALEDHLELTLEDPDEVWMDQTESGERYYTFISHFSGNEKENYHYVVITLAIDGIPSFVFLNFATRDEDLVQHYRKGAEVKLNDSGPILYRKKEKEEKKQENRDHPLNLNQGSVSEQLERILVEHRHPDDIRKEDFEKFEPFVDFTVDDPDEIWSLGEIDGYNWYTFLSRHEVSVEEEAAQAKPGENASGSAQMTYSFLMIVVCRSGKNNPRLDVVFSVPTIDPGFAQLFRKGVNSLNKAFGSGWASGSAA